MSTTLTPDMPPPTQTAPEAAPPTAPEPSFKVGSDKNPSGMSLRDAIEKTDLSKGAPKPKQETAAKAPEVPAEVKETNKELNKTPEPTKTAEEKPVKPEGKASPLDKIDAPEEARTEKTPDQGGETTDDLPDAPPKDQAVWTRTKKENKELKARLQEIEPKLKELEAKTSTFDDEKVREYEEMKEWRAREHVKETPEYKEKAAAPYSEGLTKINQVSEFTGIAAKDIMEALTEPNDLLRLTKINKLVSSSNNELDDKAIDASVQAIIRADDLIQKGTAEHNRIMEEAQAKKDQWETRQSVERLKAETEAKKIRTEARSEAREELRARLDDLVKAKYISEDDFDSFMEAEDSADPNDEAFRTAMEHLGPKLIKSLRAAHKKISEMEKEAKESRATRPSVTPSAPKANGAPAFNSLAEARQAQKGWVPGR